MITTNRIWIWLITLIAAALRLWKLDEWSFWEDEVYTIQDAQLLPQLTSVNFLPYLLVRLCTGIFGINEWAARLGPCFIGIISIPILYYLVRQTLGKDEALLAAIITSFSPWHLFWSQNARAYSLTFLLATISAFSFYLALEKNSLNLILSAIFFSVLMILSHVLSTFLLIGLFGYILVLYLMPVERPKGFTKKNLLSFFVPFIIPILLLLYPKFGEYFFSGWGRNEWGRDPIYIILTLVSGVGVPTFIIAAFSAIIFLKALDRRAIFLVSYALLPLISFLFLSFFFNVAGYYLFFTLPAYLTLAAWGCWYLLDKFKGVESLMGLAFAAIIIGSFLSQDYLYYRLENGGRPRWREAINIVKDQMKPDDEVVTSSPRVINYYLPKAKVSFIKDVLTNEPAFKSEWTSRGNRNGIWFIIDDDVFQVIDPKGRFRSWVYANSRLVATFPVYIRYSNRTISVYKLSAVSR